MSSQYQRSPVQPQTRLRPKTDLVTCGNHDLLVLNTTGLPTLAIAPSCPLMRHPVHPLSSSTAPIQLQARPTTLPNAAPTILYHWGTLALCSRSSIPKKRNFVFKVKQLPDLEQVDSVIARTRTTVVAKSLQRHVASFPPSTTVFGKF